MELGCIIPLIGWEWRIRIAQWLAGSGARLERAGPRHFVAELKDFAEPREIAEPRAIVEQQDFAGRREAVAREVLFPRGPRPRPIVALLAGSKTEA